MTSASGSGADSGTLLGSAFAPAKINLALHITGRRADGYHRLDSLVVFAAVGDTIEAIAAPNSTEPALDMIGPFAAGLDGGSDNLVMRAAHAHAAAGGRIDGLALRLIKRLPVASGIGGGSADAAATLRLLDKIAPLPSRDPDARLAMATSLGADVPMCLHSSPLRATGIGEWVDPLYPFPALPMVLVNPGIAVSTPAVFKRLQHADNLPLPEIPPAFADPAALVEWLVQTRNDLEAPAIEALPVIADCLAALNETAGCRLARMSGSGATVFGLFADASMAERAAERIAAQHPDWWVVATTAEGA
jgi:4-diphosphocytidyl-2-C-methyl-D-erythritol kinase